MQWAVMARGAAVAFLIAAPLGPNGLLCIRRTLAQGWRAGLAHGLGAATAHALYAALAALGLAAAAGVLTGGQRGLALLGAVVLCILGWRAWRATPATGGPAAGAAQLPVVYAVGLLLTLTNPITVLAFAAAGAGVLGSAPEQVAAGAFLGSAAWWVFLSGVTGRLRALLPGRALGVAQRASGAALGALGLLALAAALR
jgi:threonine/homoserine/homoserine lactone efflux protein